MLAIGKVGRLFGGSDGGVIVTFYDDFEGPLFVFLDGLAVPLFVESVQWRGKSAVVRFADVDTPGRAAELVGEELYVEGSEGDFSDDIVGWTAVLDEGVQGIVTDLFDGPNPLFQIEYEGRELLVPVAFMTVADPDRRCLFFDLPDGLIDLNG